jgi:hypothetical protein
MDYIEDNADAQNYNQELKEEGFETESLNGNTEGYSDNFEKISHKELKIEPSHEFLEHSTDIDRELKNIDLEDDLMPSSENSQQDQFLNQQKTILESETNDKVAENLSNPPKPQDFFQQEMTQEEKTISIEEPVPTTDNYYQSNSQIPSFNQPTTNPISSNFVEKTEIIPPAPSFSNNTNNFKNPNNISSNPVSRKPKLPIGLIAIGFFSVFFAGIYFFTAPALRAQNYISRINPIIKEINDKNDEFRSTFGELESHGFPTEEDMVNGNYDIKDVLNYYDEMEKKSLEFESHFKSIRNNLSKIDSPKKEFEELHASLISFLDLGEELSRETNQISKYFKQIFSIKEFEEMKKLNTDSAVETADGLRKIIDINNRLLTEMEKITPSKEAENMHNNFKELYRLNSILLEKMVNFIVAMENSDFDRIVEMGNEGTKELQAVEKITRDIERELASIIQKYKKMEEIVSSINKQMDELSLKGQIRFFKMTKFEDKIIYKLPIFC